VITVDEVALGVSPAGTDVEVSWAVVVEVEEEEECMEGHLPAITTVDVTREVEEDRTTVVDVVVPLLGLDHLITGVGSV
jgi:hypothetical protein